MTIQEAIDSGSVEVRRLSRRNNLDSCGREHVILHIPCEKCRHCLYWKCSTEISPLEVYRDYLWEVVCGLDHSPADRCSDYRARPLWQRLKERLDDSK